MMQIIVLVLACIVLSAFVTHCFITERNRIRTCDNCGNVVLESNRPIFINPYLRQKLCMTCFKNKSKTENGNVEIGWHVSYSNREIIEKITDNAYDKGIVLYLKRLKLQEE